MNRFYNLLPILLVLGGCGVKEKIETALAVSQEAYETAQQILSSGESALGTLEEEEALGEENLSPPGDPSPNPQGGLFAPSIEPLAQGSFQQEVTWETYGGGRVKSLRVKRTYSSGPVSESTTNLFFVYGSAPGGNDLNDTPPSPSYVSSTVTSSTLFKKVDTPATLQGFRAWHSSPLTHYLHFDLLFTLPSHPLSPFRTLHWYGSGDRYNGEFTRIVELNNGEKDTRNWKYTAEGSVVQIQYNRSGPEGFRAEGSGSRDLKGTPRCPLDDTGSFTLTRTFPVTDDTSVHPVKETIVVQLEPSEPGKPSKRTTTGTLTLSNGTTRTKTSTLTIRKPSSCFEPLDPQETDLVVKTYRGAEISLSITKNQGVTTIQGTRNLPSGAQDSFTLIRTEDGSGQIVNIRKNPQGKVVAVLELTITPSRYATGTLTITKADGSTEVITIEREIHGGYLLRKPTAPRREFRRINRGEL